MFGGLNSDHVPRGAARTWIEPVSLLSTSVGYVAMVKVRASVDLVAYPVKPKIPNRANNPPLISKNNRTSVRATQGQRLGLRGGYGV